MNDVYPTVSKIDLDQAKNLETGADFIITNYFTIHEDVGAQPPTLFMFCGKTVRTVAFFGYDHMNETTKWKWQNVMNKYVRKFYPKLVGLCCEYPKGQMHILMEDKTKQDLHSHFIYGPAGARKIGEECDNTYLAPGSILYDRNWCFFNKDNSPSLS